MNHRVATNSFGTFLSSLTQVDFFTILLPFVISYVIFKLAIDQLSLFDDSENMGALVALALSFFTAQYIAINPVYQQFFIEFFGRITIGMIGILGLFILMSLAGFGDVGGDSLLLKVGVVVAVAAAFTYAGGLGAFVPFDIFQEGGTLLNTLFQSGLLWLLVIVAVVYWTYDSDGDGGNNLGGLLGGGE